jgi:hypothetical protein
MYSIKKEKTNPEYNKGADFSGRDDGSEDMPRYHGKQ